MLSQITWVCVMITEFQYYELLAEKDQLQAENTKLREALERSVEHIEHEGHDCDYYHIPETGICRWCYMVSDLKQALKEVE